MEKLKFDICSMMDIILSVEANLLCSGSGSRRNCLTREHSASISCGKCLNLTASTQASYNQVPKLLYAANAGYVQ